MAAITFTDAIGAAALRNNYPATSGGRFASWTPTTRNFGDAVNRLSDGAVTMFSYRTDYGASFELHGIPVKAQTGGTNYVSIADRLIAWLLIGGTCAIACEDTPVSVYATCGLWPGSVPSLTISDRRFLEWTLSLQVLNLAVSPVQMIAVYG